MSAFKMLPETDRNSEEESLRRTEATFRGIFDSSPHSYMLIDRHERIQAFNKQANQTAKWVFNRELEKGISIYEFIFAQDAASYRCNFQKALVGESVIVEKNILGNNGVDNWFEFIHNPVFNEMGEIIAVCNITSNIDARKKDALALVQSERLFRTLVQNSADIITVVAPNGIISYQSSSIEHILNYQFKDWIDKNFFDFVHPEDGATLQKALTEALTNKNPIQSPQFRLRNNQNQWLYFKATIQNFLAEPNINGLVINARDITKKRQFSEQLRLLQRAIDASTNGIIITDALLPDNPTIYVNQGFEKVSGYKAEEIIGQNCRFLQNNDRDEVVLGEIRTATEEGRECKVAMRNYRKDGTMFWNQLSVSPIYNAEGKITNFVGIMQNVTDSVVADQALQASEERYRFVAETASDVIITVDENGCITFLNPAIKKIFGYEVIELLGKPLTLIMPDYLQIAHIKAFNAYQNTDTRHLNWDGVEVHGLHKNGTEITVELSFGESLKDGKHLFTGIIRDITERKEAQKVLHRAKEELEIRVVQRTMELSIINSKLQLEILERQKIEAALQIALEKEKELNELKSRFISLASHEFRTPLTVIMSSSELLESYGHQLQPDKIEKCFQRIRTSVDHMTDLLNDVLLLSKLETQKLEAQLTELDVVKVCRTIAEEFQSGIIDKNLLELNFLQEQIRACLDEKLIRQIITNLLSNAFKYSPNGSRVQFTISQTFEKVLIFEVKDEGIGIPLADQLRVFEPFHRAHNGDAVPGTGLGLSIVKHCVDLHYGEITFDTELNKGTTFVVKLPNLCN